MDENKNHLQKDMLLDGIISLCSKCFCGSALAKLHNLTVFPVASEYG